MVTGSDCDVRGSEVLPVPVSLVFPVDCGVCSRLGTVGGSTLRVSDTVTSRRGKFEAGPGVGFLQIKFSLKVDLVSSKLHLNVHSLVSKQLMHFSRLSGIIKPDIFEKM